jgi:hypothetical protein
METYLRCFIYIHWHALVWLLLTLRQLFRKNQVDPQNLCGRDLMLEKSSLRSGRGLRLGWGSWRSRRDLRLGQGSWRSRRDLRLGQGSWRSRRDLRLGQGSWRSRRDIRWGRISLRSRRDLRWDEVVWEACHLWSALAVCWMIVSEAAGEFYQLPPT